MYFSHFGLSEAPFGMTPNPSFFFTGSGRGDILQALLYAVSRGEGIIKVTGEVGSGKTMLCRMLESLLPPEVDVIYLANPTLAKEQVVYALAAELKLEINNLRKDEVIRALEQDLIARHIRGRQVLLLVEEAQAMSLDTLEEIRLFSNLETTRHKLLQIILFGQPELNDQLALPRMRQLQERITHSFHVPPLEKHQIGEFLLFRLRQAGYRGPNIFSQPAIQQLGQVSQGIIRRINILADKAMLAAFADNTHSIGRKQMLAAIRDSEFTRLQRQAPILPATFGVLAALALVAGVIYWYNTRLPELQPPQPPQPPSNSASAPSSQPIASPAKASAVPSAAASAAPSATPSAAATASPLNVASSGPSTVPSTVSTTAPITAPTTAPATQPTASAVQPSKPAASELAASKPNDAPARDTKVSATVLQQRLHFTKQWLHDAQAERHTLQVIMVAANKHAELEFFLKKMQQTIDLNPLLIYPSNVGGVSRYGVLLGDFDSRAKAKEHMQKLQKEFGYAAQIRTVAGLRAEIISSKSENLWQATP